MKKGTKALVALLLGCGLLLGACNSKKGGTEPGGDTPGGETTQYTVTINNKSALQAEWYANGGGRKVELTVDPKANIAQLINNGTITLESSNTAVLTIAGQMAMPVAAGNATITVKSGASSDSVAVVISKALTIKEKYGVDHEGTEDDPLTNEDAISIATNPLYNEAGGKEDLHVRGIVSSFYHPPGSRDDGATSWYLTPAEGKTEKFEVYKCYKQGTGEASYLTDQDVWTGADVLVHGRFTVYGTQAETDGATYVRAWGEPPAPRTVIEASFAEALAAGKALEDGADTYDYYQFDAYVTKNSGKNYFLTATQGEAITDDKENTIEIYNASANGLADKLLKNAKVTVKMVIKNYHGQVENSLALAADDVTVLEPGSAWVVPEHDVTVAQALEVIAGLNDGQTTEDLYNFKEVYVKEVTGAYNDQYKNMSFTIADTADGTDTITVFRAKTDAETAAKVVAGAQVTIKGNLQKYVKDDAVTPELLNVASIAVKGDVPPTPVEINYGTLENPLNIAEVKAELDKIGSGVTSEEHFFVKGFVSSNAEISTEKYGIIWLTNDDGSVEREFEIYNGYGDQAYAAGALVGKEIIVEGFGKIYQGTYELTSVKLGDNNYDNPVIRAVTANTREAESLVFDVEAGFELEQGAEKAAAAGIRPFPVTGTINYAVAPADKGVTYEGGKIKAAADAEKGDYKLVASLEGTEIEAELAFTVVEGGGGGGQTEKTATFLPDGSHTDRAAFTLTVDPISAACSDGIVNSDQIRIYKNSTFTLSGATITKIEFTCTASGSAQYGPGCFTVASGEYAVNENVGTWTGEATNIVFTASSNQVRCTQIVVTYVA